MAFKIVPLSKAVTAAGTRVALSASNLYVLGLSIQAKKANTGKIYVGDVTVAAALGHELESGESIGFDAFAKPASLEEVNLADVYIDSSVNGEGVNVTYVLRRANG